MIKKIKNIIKKPYIFCFQNFRCVSVPNILFKANCIESKTYVDVINRIRNPIIPILVRFFTIFVILLSTKPDITGILSSTNTSILDCIENLLITTPDIEINISSAGNIDNIE